MKINIKWIMISFLILISSFIEGNVIINIKSIQLESWMLISYQAVIVSLCAHLLMFYLYKFYPVTNVLPFYSLFPIFGIALTYLIFNETLSIYEIVGGILVIGSAYFCLLYTSPSPRDS